MMGFRRQTRCAAFAAWLAAWAVGTAAPLWQWKGLEDRWQRKSRIFGSGAPDQRDVLQALQAAKYTAGVGSVERFEQRVRRHPFDLAARHLLALAYQRGGDLSQAVEQYTQVLRFAPEHPCRLDLAEAYEATGRRDLAAQELARLLRFRPRLARPRERLARLYESLGRFTEAADARHVLLGLAPEDFTNRKRLAAALRRAGRPAEGAQVAQAAANEAGADQRLPLLLELAACRRAEGDHEAALKVLEEAREEHPQAALLPVGLILLHQGAWAKARTHMQNASQEQDSSAVALAGAAAATLGAGDVSDAVARCARLRERGVAHAARFLLACVWLHEGDQTALRAVFATAPGGGDGDMATAFGDLLQAMLARLAERQELALRLAKAQVFRLAGWRTEAVQTAEAALELAPESVLVAMVLADSYASVGESEKQVKLLRRLVAANPGNDAALVGLAKGLAAQRSYREAGQVCRRLLERSPDHPEARLVLARVARRRGQYAAAVPQLQRLLEGDTENRAVLRLLVDALVSREKLAQAADAVDLFQQRNSDFQPDLVEELVGALARRDEAAVRGQAEAGLLIAPHNPRLRRLTGLLLVREGKPEAALEHFRTAALLAPLHFAGRRWLAQTAERQGHLREALSAYQRLGRTVPERTEIQLQIADLLTRLGHADQALSRLKALEPTEPGQRRAVQVQLAAEYLRRQERAKALQIAKAVLDEDPLHSRAAGICLFVYRARDELNEAAALCQQMVRGGQTTGFGGELGAIRLLQGNAKEAADVLATAEEEADKRGKALLRASRAAALLRQGKTEAARQAALAAEQFPERTVAEASALQASLAAAGADEGAQRELKRIENMIADLAAWHRGARSALEQDPRLVDDYLAAAVARRHGWHKRALARLRQAIARGPKEPLFLYAAIEAARDAAEPEPAAALAERLVEVAPKTGYAHYLHGRALELAGQAEAAGRAYAAAVKFLGKHSSRLWFALARQLQRSGRVPQAIEAYQRLLEVDPERISACNNLAYLYARARPDRLEEAERLARKAVDAQPGNASFHDTMGRVYVEQRKFEKAMEHLAVALEAEPPPASSYASLGMMYFAQKKSDRARMALRHALRLDPALPEAETLRAMLKVLQPKPSGAESPASAPEAGAEKPPGD